MKPQCYNLGQNTIVVQRSIDLNAMSFLEEDLIENVEFPCGCIIEKTYKNVSVILDMSIQIYTIERLIHCPKHALGGEIVRVVQEASND